MIRDILVRRPSYVVATMGDAWLEIITLLSLQGAMYLYVQYNTRTHKFTFPCKTCWQLAIVSVRQTTDVSGMWAREGKMFERLEE